MLSDETKCNLLHLNQLNVKLQLTAKSLCIEPATTKNYIIYAPLKDFPVNLLSCLFKSSEFFLNSLLL